jgi:hypothetical protein
VRLRDSLQSNLDISSMELLDASHPYTFQMANGIAHWRFENILLPDSATNPGGSMGFAKYRIKTVPGLTAGSQVDNFADIYFDYNAPVRTPTATVLIQNPVAASDEVQVLPGFTVFPNPNNGQFAFRSDKAISSTRQCQVARPPRPSTVGKGTARFGGQSSRPMSDHGFATRHLPAAIEFGWEKRLSEGGGSVIARLLTE